MTGAVRLRLRVTGRVQGVGFRWFVKERARQLGLAGWVRNEADGSVLLEVEGPEEPVAELRRAVEQGPAGAHVAGVSPLVPSTDILPQRFAVER